MKKKSLAGRKNSSVLGEPVQKRVQVCLAWFSHQTVRGIARYAREAGWQLDLSPSYLGLSSYPVPADGMITFFHADSPMAGFIRKRAQEIPVVDMTGQADDLQAALVLPDNRAIGRMGARHLLERGYGTLAYVSIWGIFSERERLAGFKSEVELAGKRFMVLDYQTRPDAERGLDQQAWLRESLKRLPKPVAVMPLSDPVAMKVLCACSEAGIQVPDEIAIIGADNDDLICDFASVPLSSVDSDMEKVGYEAAALLDRLMAGEPAPRDPVLIAPKEVVPRRSTDMLAVSHPALVRSVRFICDHYRKPIQTRDVVAASGMSRRGLYKLFASELNSTATREITKLRLKHAVRLLKGTRIKTAAVAEESGLGNYIQLHRLIKRHLGMSPGALRKSAT